MFKIIKLTMYSFDEKEYTYQFSLRENGKLILLLSTKELIIMNKMHMVQDQPCDYMLDKLDEFLMSLEK